MADSWKIRDNGGVLDFRPMQVEHRFDGVPTGTDDFNADFPEYVDSDLYATTERNLPKNGGKRPRLVSPIAWEVKAARVSNDFVRTRIFDWRTNKFVDKLELRVSPARLVRKVQLDKDLSFVKANDLIRFTQDVSLPQCNDLSVTSSDTHSVDTYGGDYILASSLASLKCAMPVVDTQSDMLIRHATHIEECGQKALSRLYASIKSQPADLGTDIAEGRQTIKLILDWSTRLAETALHSKKLNLQKAIVTLLPVTKKRIANDFLAFRYGVAPLIDDITGMIKDVSSHIDDTFKREATGRTTRVYDDSFPFMGGTITRHTVITVKYKCIFGVDGDLVDLLARYGLTNPANVAWELVPFSFVVDWFLPIGPWLNALGAFDHYTLKQLHRTIIVSDELSFDGPIESLSSSSVSGPDLSYNWSVVSFLLKREVIPELPAMPKPTFKNPISTGHLANALALITQVLSRGK